MPLYEYKCTKCEKDYDKIKSFSEDADSDICPYCGSASVRIFSGAPIVEYHASGYYVTDHKKEARKNE